MKGVKLGLLCLLVGVVLAACNKEKEGYSKKSDYKETAFDMDLSMVYVEGGTFMMGATPEQGDDAFDEEKPAYKVTLTSYHISKYEITQAQWESVMGTTIQEQFDKGGLSLPLSGVGNNHPMYHISWFEAKAFCDALSEKTGKKYALPTEAQWEFAARGGTKSKGYKYSGSSAIGDVAWYNSNSNGKTHTVGTKTANELGIHDMSGNVLEWCADWYGPYSGDAVTNPTGPNSGSYRVFRGGGCSDSYDDGVVFDGYRVSSRFYQRPDWRGFFRQTATDPGQFFHLGFRVVCLQ